MSLVDFFTPINLSEFSGSNGFYNSQFGKVVQVYEDSFPELEDVEVKRYTNYNFF